MNWCVCASVCFSPASSLARGCSLTLQLYIKPKTQVKVYVSVPFKDLSLSSHPATAVTSSNNSVYIWGCMSTCVTRSWALRMDWVGKKTSPMKEFQLATKVVFLCQSLTCGSAYASLQMHLFIFELMHSSNVTFTRFS